VSRTREAAAPTFTVFTPTYNRADALARPFGSLMAQTSRDFEWLVVDNASTDATADLVEGWRASAPFPIVFIRNPENLGFARSWNRAVEAARGELFVYLRSADELAPTALERLASHWAAIPPARRAGFTGVTGLVSDEHGVLIGHPFPEPVMDSDAREIYYRYRMRAETFGCNRTDVLRRHPMPEIDGYIGPVPQSMLWRQIARTHRMRYVNDVLRIFWQDRSDSMSQPSVPAAVAPGHVVRTRETLNHDLAWMRHDPVDVYLDAVAFVISSRRLGHGLSRQVASLETPAARALWLAALPAAYAHAILRRTQRILRRA
jgi:glycosyltransferase involved in cell wall biosynthesis